MNDYSSSAPAPKGRGCFFYGCLTSVVLLLLAGLLVFLGVRFVRNKLNAYTDAQPLKMPKVEMTDAEFQILQQRMKAFAAALEQGMPLEPLSLNERDLNALIGLSPNTKELADKVHVSLNGNEVKGMVSIPLSGLGWLGKGRYLNGDATFKVSLENGVLIVTAQEIRVKGVPIPESFMGPLRRENLAKEAYKDPQNAETIRKFESIQVEDSQVTVKARAPQ
jgi:hypothetical protein